MHETNPNDQEVFLARKRSIRSLKMPRSIQVRIRPKRNLSRLKITPRLSFTKLRGSYKKTANLQNLRKLHRYSLPSMPCDPV